jgi:hypothetical protein
VYQVAGDDEEHDVVVMPSPPDTECVVDMLQRGELPRWKDAAAAAGEDAV